MHCNCNLGKFIAIFSSGGHPNQEYAQMKITPLLLAAQRNSIEILELLLKNGVGIIMRDN